MVSRSTSKRCNWLPTWLRSREFWFLHGIPALLGLTFALLFSIIFLINFATQSYIWRTTQTLLEKRYFPAFAVCGQLPFSVNSSSALPPTVSYLFDDAVCTVQRVDSSNVGIISPCEIASISGNFESTGAYSCSVGNAECVIFNYGGSAFASNNNEVLDEDELHLQVTITPSSYFNTVFKVFLFTPFPNAETLAAVPNDATLCSFVPRSKLDARDIEVFLATVPEMYSLRMSASDVNFFDSSQNFRELDFSVSDILVYRLFQPQSTVPFHSGSMSPRTAPVSLEKTNFDDREVVCSFVRHVLYSDRSSSRFASSSLDAQCQWLYSMGVNSVDDISLLQDSDFDSVIPQLFTRISARKLVMSVRENISKNPPSTVQRTKTIPSNHQNQLHRTQILSDPSLPSTPLSPHTLRVNPASYGPGTNITTVIQILVQWDNYIEQVASQVYPTTPLMLLTSILATLGTGSTIFALSSFVFEFLYKKSISAIQSKQHEKFREELPIALLARSESVASGVEPQSEFQKFSRNFNDRISKRYEHLSLQG